MHDSNNSSQLKYMETKTYDESGKLLYTTSSSNPGNFFQVGDFPQYPHNPYFNPPAEQFIFPPTITTTDHTVGNMNNTLRDFLEKKKDKEKDKEKEIKREEIINVTRLNVLKEILDQFDSCNSYDDVDRVLDCLRKNYKKLVEE